MLRKMRPCILSVINLSHVMRIGLTHLSLVNTRHINMSYAKERGLCYVLHPTNIINAKVWMFVTQSRFNGSSDLD
jgi:hypothetical protein